MLWWICMHIICLWISYTLDLNLLRRNLGFLHQVHSTNSNFYYTSSRPTFKMWLEFCNMCGFTAFFYKSKRIFVLHNPVWIPKRIAVEKYNNIRRRKSITEKFLKMYIFLRLDFNRKSSPCWYGYLDI